MQLQPSLYLIVFFFVSNKVFRDDFQWNWGERVEVVEWSYKDRSGHSLHLNGQSNSFPQKLLGLSDALDVTLPVA